jgi:hypothetical protein
MGITKIRGLPQRTMFRTLRITFDEKFDPKEKFMVGGKVRTAGALAAEFAAAEPYFVKVDEAKANMHQLVIERDAALVAPAALAKQSLTTLEAQWGADPEKLANAGIPAKKQKRQLTAKELYAAALKRNLTRKMRGTMGSRQKADVRAMGKMNVSGELAGMQAPGSSQKPESTANGGANGQTNQAVPTPNGANPIA